MYCEICGKKIENPFMIEFGKRYLKVCEECKSLGKVTQAKPLAQPKPKKSTSVIKKEMNRPMVMKEIELTVREDYAQVIRRAREDMGLTQDMLASVIGEKLSVIKKIEGGKIKPTIDIARKLEKVLKISLLEEVNLEEKMLDKIGKKELTLGEIVEIKDK